MKVELREDGTLLVAAENGSEAYALKHWAATYFAAYEFLPRDLSKGPPDAVLMVKSRLEP